MIQYGTRAAEKNRCIKKMGRLTLLTLVGFRLAIRLCFCL